MTKKELAEVILKAAADEKIVLSGAASERITTKVLNSFTDSLVKGEDIAFVGFGTLKVAERSERKARNPMTGEEITVPAHKTVKFKLAKALKEKLN